MYLKDIRIIKRTTPVVKDWHGQPHLSDALWQLHVA